MARINTYPENTSIEDNDSLLTYDGSASATKITPFSRIWTWVQSKLNALGKQNAIASADQLLMVKGGNTTGRIDYNVLAKAIIEQYNGSTIAGSAQTLQSALNALNSKLTNRTITTGSFDDINEQGFYYVTAGVTGAPTGSTYFWRLRVEVYSGAASQYANKNGANELYYRYKTNNVWSVWSKIQTDVV